VLQPDNVKPSPILPEVFTPDLLISVECFGFRNSHSRKKSQLDRSVSFVTSLKENTTLAAYIKMSATLVSITDRCRNELLIRSEDIFRV
jgi:hypothetical protein